MRFIFLSLDFGLLLLALVALLQGARAQYDEKCPAENCVSADKCEQLHRGNLPCGAPGTTCCSVLKSEFRTHCRHHGGECMSRCSTIISRHATDCKPSETCCVLV